MYWWWLAMALLTALPGSMFLSRFSEERALWTIDAYIPRDGKFDFGPLEFIRLDPSCGAEALEYPSFKIVCNAPPWWVAFFEAKPAVWPSDTPVFRYDLLGRVPPMASIKTHDEFVWFWPLPKDVETLEHALVRREDVVARSFGQGRVVEERHPTVANGRLRCRVYKGVHGTMVSWIGFRYFSKVNVMMTATQLGSDPKCDGDALPIVEIFNSIVDKESFGR